jgi:hypothetical protein
MRKEVSPRVSRVRSLKDSALGGSIYPRGILSAFCAMMLALCASLTISACATNSYAGISFAPGAADPELQALARRARAGDEQAQLELGIRYEHGRGVAINLSRALDLYFDAATKPAERIPIYIPTPGGTVSGFVHRFPQGYEYSGNEEALLRWNRLITALSLDESGVEGSVLPPVSEPPGITRPSRMTGGRDQDFAEAQQRAFDRLVDGHAYQPIFNGLKDRQGDWETRIVAEGGARFLTRASISDAFLFVINPDVTLRPGHAVSDEQISTFCAHNLPADTRLDSAHRRILGLCAIHDCSAVNDEHWASVSRSIALDIDLRPDGNPDRQILAHDAAFLLRVAALCMKRSVAESLSHYLEAYFASMEPLLKRCRNQACAPEESIAARQVLAIDAHLLFAAAETEMVPATLLGNVARDWREGGLSAPAPDRVTDESIEDLCSVALVEPTDCRRMFPQSFFLEQRFLDEMARRLEDVHHGRNVCEIVRYLISQYHDEIQIRFAKNIRAGDRFSFAPRCR